MGSPLNFKPRPLALFLPWLLNLVVLLSTCTPEPKPGSHPASPQSLALSPVEHPATPSLVLSSPSPIETTPPGETAIPSYRYEILQTYPHDPGAFTQGLVYQNGFFYESTGLLGQSTLRRVELETGAVVQLHALPDQVFGEGLTLLNRRLYQVTWQSHLGFVYDQDTFEVLQTFEYPTEGWGLTHDGARLIMSDGSATLHFLDPETLEETGRLEVIGPDGNPVPRLNELEVIQGDLYANIWPTDRIACINLQTGQVTAWINLAGLLNAHGLSQPVDVLNGIAYDVEGDRLFVTGKWWPTMFQIRLIRD
ncbi:MAG: glutaminyl-peptide cyclotransferase [Anaerolineae bacterium]